MIRGRPPKPDGVERTHRVQPRHDVVHLAWDGVVRGPKLPAGRVWCVQTKRWYQHWRESANALLMTETDWDRLLETAVLHNMLWGPPMNGVNITQVASEIRQRTSALGATIADRRNLRIQIDTDGENSETDPVDQDVAAMLYDVERLTKKAAELRAKPEK